jgi:tetratricopeptide (TPR) repeat protein
VPSVGPAILARVVLATLLGLGLGLGLIGGGLVVAPGLGMAAVAAPPPRRPPTIPLAIPADAAEETAVWSYLARIAPLWGSDWATTIELLEQLRSRYPDNLVAIEKLYAAYLEDGKQREQLGDPAGARRRYEQASALDPNRGEAWDELERLGGEYPSPSGRGPG